jgi:organic hydroperoxide reductase OsmC/OhrA
LIHHYDVAVRWTGDRGTGTSGYRDYDRTHVVESDGPPPLPGSSDPAFRGEADRWNPEQLLVASLSQCHMLWYLNLCVTAGVVVTGYSDDARGTMEEERDGGGRFTEVVLRPRVEIGDRAMADAAMSLHADAHAKCFIARSVNFAVRHEPTVSVATAPLDTALEP